MLTLKDADKVFDRAVRCYDEGDYHESIFYFKHFVEILEREAPTRSLDLARSYDNMGLAFLNENKHDEAIANFKRALDILKCVPGASDLLAASYHDLGLVLVEQGQYEEAIKHYRKAINIRKHESKHRRASSLDLAQSYLSLGLASHLEGNNDEAAASCRSAIEIYECEVPAESNHLEQDINLLLEKLG